MRQSLKVVLLIAAGAAAAVRGLVSRGQASADAPTRAERRSRSVGAWLKGQLWTTAKYFALFLVVMAIGGFLLAASGIIPIKASSGHWAITDWFLQFSKQRSVSTHSPGVDAPPLDEARLVLKGAGAYETNCLACHGSPSLPASEGGARDDSAAAVPPVGALQVGGRGTLLHRQARHQVHRDARLAGASSATTRCGRWWLSCARFPRLDAGGYERLVRGGTGASGEVAPMPEMIGPRTVPRAIGVSCARCHGADGTGRGAGAFPKLAGQSPDYLSLSLEAYARAERHSGVMEPHRRGPRASKRCASLPSTTRACRSLRRRQRLRRKCYSRSNAARPSHDRGIPTQRVPSCVVVPRPRRRPSQSRLSRPHGPVRRLPRAATRTLQEAATRRHGLRSPHAHGRRPPDPGADARRGALLRVAEFRPRTTVAVIDPVFVTPNSLRTF